MILPLPFAPIEARSVDSIPVGEAWRYERASLPRAVTAHSSCTSANPCPLGAADCGEYRQVAGALAQV